MNTETETGDEFEQDKDDRDEDEATQYMIEQSLLQYSKRKAAISSHLAGTKDEPDEIFKAVNEGDEEALRALTELPGVMSRVDHRGWIPLHEAAVQDNKHILEIVFSASPLGALHCRTLKGETPLFLAVVHGLRANATFLLQNGCNPDIQDDEEDSPLVAALINDQYDLATLLLRYNAKVDPKGPLGRTPLHEASLLGQENFVYLLLQSGANPNVYDTNMKNPLALAAQAGHLNVVEVLLQKGARVGYQSELAGSVLFDAAESGNPDIISLLLDHGADPNIALPSGHLPLHRVAYHGHVLALEQLIPVTKMEVVKESGMSPLHSAAAGGHAQCVELLLQAGYDPNFMLHPRIRRNYDDERKSALYFSVSNNDLQCTRLLLEAEAMVNQDPINCLQVALRHGNYELINTLLRYGANVNYYSGVNTTHFPSALQYALKDEVMLRMLLNHGYDVQRCFDCPYGDSSHDYAPSVVKDMVVRQSGKYGRSGVSWIMDAGHYCSLDHYCFFSLFFILPVSLSQSVPNVCFLQFCEVITVYWLKHISGLVVRIMLDYTDHVILCTKLKDILKQQKQWPEICEIQENVRSLKHLCRLRIRACLRNLRLRAPVFISFLPLPNSLKDYLRYREYDVYSRGSMASP